MIDQSILAMLPIISLSVLAGIAAIYFVSKERRESRNDSAQRKN